MNKHAFILLFLTLLLVIPINATIYDYSKSINKNPRLFLIVPGKDATQKELEAAYELSSILNVKKVFREDEIGSLNRNLILVGTSKTNTKIPDIEPSITLSSLNIIITGSPTQIIKGANILKEENPKILSLNKYKLPIEWHAPLNIFSAMSILYIIGSVTLLVTLVLIIIKKTKGSKYPQLIKYVNDAIKKGYSKEQLKPILLKSGWSQDILDREFKKIP